MDAKRKQFDVIMGANCNGDVLEISRKYFDCDVCLLFLTGLCPHDLFQLTALLLAECVMSILGENWLSEDYKFPDDQNMMHVDKIVLLVLESARIEVAILLNELAYLKYESSKNSQKDDDISQKKRNLAILFSLIERIIKIILNASSGKGASCQTIHESNIMKAINGLNETVSLVLYFLRDAKMSLHDQTLHDHGQRKEDDLLAAVRIVGSYLTEVPYACKDKTKHLLEFIFSIEGQYESRSISGMKTTVLERAALEILLLDIPKGGRPFEY
ncbi:hypothetical protein ABZP36_035137 [Zizania latifolia]